MLRLALALTLLSLPVLAAHKVLAVVPPDDAAKGGPAVELETRLGHSPEVSLIARGAQLEILGGLKLKKNARVDDTLALRLGQLSGADGIVLGEAGAWRLCRLPEGTCEALGATDAAAAAERVFTTVGASPPGPRSTPWPDETGSALARSAYASCRAAVSVAVEQAAVKGRKAQTRGIDADCRKALAADPKYLPAKAALAAARALQGDPTSEAELREALTTLPTDPLPVSALIHLLRETDREQEGLDLLAATEKTAPNWIDLKRLRAEQLYGMDMFAAALPVFQSALALAPRSPYLHWRTSSTLHMKFDDAEALKHAELASQLSGGEHPFYQEEYASRLIDVGRFADAQKVLEPLRKADPTWGRIALRLGYALYRQGEIKAALPLFEEASKARPRVKRERDDKGLADFDIARAHAKLGNADAAFKQLGILKAAGALNAIDLKEPDFDAIRDDARFAELVPP